MSYAGFENLLKQVMGLDAASIGSSAVEHAVGVRMSSCELDDMPTYLELVRTSASELQALIEVVVVPETWFFRDREAFSTMARMAFEEWLRTQPVGVMRLLSLPCSSGEEPYSMAMALLDAGFPASRFQIDAVDISTKVITHAKRGIYGKNSFRGDNLEFRDRYFESTAHGHRLSDAVRGQVNFQHANMFAPDFLPGTEIYDMIFCRNLLIYFDRATQDNAVHVLQRLLAAKGVLFVGPSETGLMLNHDFVSARVPLAFAFRKIGTEVRATAAAPVHSVQQPRQPASRPMSVRPSAAHQPLRATVHSPTHNTFHQVGKPGAESAARRDSGMEEASRLADQGHLTEAAKLCEEYLRKHGPSAPAFHLMGLIRAAAGNLTEAGQFYRKALYLDQNHHDTLLHLAYLLEKQGDASGAQVLRNRVRRLEQKNA